MATRSSVVAIIAAYNEGDVIGQVVGDLISQEVDVYLIDHGSTDDTAARVEPFLGRGLLGIERFPAEDAEIVTAGRFAWTDILERKEVLATQLEGEWFIHHDADELRESPWSDRNLREAIQMVDGFGYNAIDFELFDFWPTHDGFRPGDDMRRVFSHYTPAAHWNKLQIKCWKRSAERVDLVSSGGHEVVFPHRRVFPLRFILRHYPIRGQAHGERKVFRERRGRFDPAERARGWHVQYDAMRPGESFLRDPATMVRYDPAAARLYVTLRHRGLEATEEALEAERRARAEMVEKLQVAHESFSARCRGLEARLGELTAELEVARREVDRLVMEAAQARRENESLRDGMDTLRREVGTLYASRSWRWTAPLRTIVRWVSGR